MLDHHFLDNSPHRLIGSSPAMCKLRDEISKVAIVPAAVLLQGESGTGKELVARLIHENSRRNGSLVVVNCPAIPHASFEAELFGHEPQTYTGVARGRIGKLEEAAHGTLFLDEIADFSLDMQAAILRAVEGHPFERLGGKDKIWPSFRLVAATHKPLASLVDCGKFRGDLYHRINVVPIHLPPLRHRLEDIPELAEHFLSSGSIRRADSPGISTEAMAKLQSYDWPGNVRQLHNVLFRAAIYCEGVIAPDDVVLNCPLPNGAQDTRKPENDASPILCDREMRRKHAQKALARNHGNRAKTARALGISTGTLNRLLKPRQAPE